MKKTSNIDEVVQILEKIYLDSQTFKIVQIYSGFFKLKKNKKIYTKVYLYYFSIHNQKEERSKNWHRRIRGA